MRLYALRLSHADITPMSADSLPLSFFLLLAAYFISAFAAYCRTAPLKRVAAAGCRCALFFVCYARRCWRYLRRAIMPMLCCLRCLRFRHCRHAMLSRRLPPHAAAALRLIQTPLLELRFYLIFCLRHAFAPLCLHVFRRCLPLLLSCRYLTYAAAAAHAADTPLLPFDATPYHANITTAHTPIIFIRHVSPCHTSAPMLCCPFMPRRERPSTIASGETCRCRCLPAMPFYGAMPYAFYADTPCRQNSIR